ncbi:MAG: hypothetical protein IKF09_03715, partial [Clostridiales bacterium]|nr:hypothetical protein [Clostridiales bacterium]
MAIIESLSVANGGGVVSSASQSKQIENTVSIFIGLGGTGTDAIRCIKKQVNERLNPDNAEAYDNPNSNVSIREYRHIKFLSVDTDYRALKRSDYDILDSTEKWYLSLPDYRKDNDTASRPDLKWINTKEKSILSNVIARGNGTGGFRQIGRYLFYEKIDAFEEKIIQLVDEAKEGISDSRVVVHIFSSVSGGTGSGMFLDVCYAVRKALSGIANKMIVGYFFMPDISLSVKGLDNNSRKNISYNGYAALQELNYCMGFPNNGGSFRQVIKDGTYLEWNCRPVDTCHIIGAQTENFAVVTDDAYDYAMHTVTEYVMHYLYENHYNDFVSIYALMSDQCRRKVSVLSLRTGGYNPCLVSLGAACASIPY